MFSLIRCFIRIERIIPKRILNPRMTQGHSCNLYPQNSWLAKLLHKAPKANFWKPLSHSSHASYFAICKAQSTKASGRGSVPAALPEALSHNIIAEYSRFKDQFGFRVLQLGTRNPKLRTFTSYNHISQKRHLSAEDFQHRKQGLSPQAPYAKSTNVKMQNLGGSSISNSGR